MSASAVQPEPNPQRAVYEQACNVAWAACQVAPAHARRRVYERWDRIGNTYLDVLRGLHDLRAMAASYAAPGTVAPPTRRRGAGRPRVKRTVQRCGDSGDDGPPHPPGPHVAATAPSTWGAT